MPELPEVEAVRRSLIKHVVGCLVFKSTLHRRDVVIVPGDPVGGFSRRRDNARSPARVRKPDLLAGARVVEILRRGKQLALIGEQPDGSRIALGAHLGMTGHFEFVPTGAKMLSAIGRHDQHVHVTWQFEHGQLVFSDPRRFGGLRVFRDLALLHEFMNTLGPDALDVAPNELHAALRGKSTSIKAALLDQRVLAGVGNIYCDESLFQAGILPSRKASSLDDMEIKRLAWSIREILGAAVQAGGSSIQDYADASGVSGSYQLLHRVYERAGRPCVVCGKLLLGEALAQRATVWCPHCQH